MLKYSYQNTRIYDVEYVCLLTHQVKTYSRIREFPNLQALVNKMASGNTDN